jgi:enoyl-CoA hydratase/carnithine racemase
VAAIDGAAIGGGLGLACACDGVVATERSTFGLPELLWGLVPAIIWPVVTDRMAPHVARQWTISAHSRTAADAHAAGVVDEVIADGMLDAGLRRSLRALGRVEPRALARLRAWSRESRALPLADATARGAALTATLMTEPQVQARWRAFTEGEAPWCA